MPVGLSICSPPMEKHLVVSERKLCQCWCEKARKHIDTSNDMTLAVRQTNCPPVCLCVQSICNFVLWTPFVVFL